MEPLTKKSVINVARDTDVVRVADTEMCWQEIHESKVFPTTPCNNSTRQYTFQILPNSSELHPPSCDLVVDFKLTKADNTPIGETDQVGCIQSLGVCAWQSVNVRINGVLYQPEFPFSEHAFYFKQMGSYTERERKAIFESVGFQSDTVGRSATKDPTIDPSCACKVSKILMLIYIWY